MAMAKDAWMHQARYALNSIADKKHRNTILGLVQCHLHGRPIGAALDRPQTVTAQEYYETLVLDPVFLAALDEVLALAVRAVNEQAHDTLDSTMRQWIAILPETLATLRGLLGPQHKEETRIKAAIALADRATQARPPMPTQEPEWILAAKRLGIDPEIVFAQMVAYLSAAQIRDD
jgi:hypothetical protein